MGFAEIQAAFAAQGQAPAPQPAAVQAPVPAAPVQFTPSPFGANTIAPAPAFNPPAPAIVMPTPSQASFTFTPPAGFNSASAPPINPPGERAALAAPTPAAPNPPVAAAPAEAPGVTAAPTSPAPTLPSAAGFSPPSAPAEPKRRGRKPGAKNAGGMPGVVAEAPVIGITMNELEQIHARGHAAVTADLAADGAAIAAMPPDGSSVEDIVSELFARGVSAVNLTFTKDGK